MTTSFEILQAQLSVPDRPIEVTLFHEHLRGLVDKLNDDIPNDAERASIALNLAQSFYYTVLFRMTPPLIPDALETIARDAANKFYHSVFPLIEQLYGDPQ